MNHIAQTIAKAALEVGAIKLQPNDPFTWTTGYRMPIYNDNRKFMSSPAHRKLVAESFREVLSKNNIRPDIIAGTATAGIAPATSLADLLELPLIYVREKSKGHGMKNQIEGIVRPGAHVLLVEDLVSTGGSAIAALAALREAGMKVDHCVSIFTYAFPEAEASFEGHNCTLHSLLSFPELLETAVETSVISASEEQLLKSWNSAPFAWGELNGFPKVVR